MRAGCVAGVRSALVGGALVWGALVGGALAGGALGCVTPAPPPDASMPQDAWQEPVRVEIGTRESGARFTPWHDGDAIAEVYGPQGGVMITPAVAIDGQLVIGDAPGLDVALENLVLPERTPLPGFGSFGPLHVLFARLDTRLVNGPLYDQLGWTDVTGLRLLVRAHVSGMGIDAWGEVEIVVGGAVGPPPDTGAFDGLDGGA